MATPSTRPSGWKRAAPEALPATLTFAAQSNLPKLPVPDLERTLTRLKESLKPIAWTDSEYAAVDAKIDKFSTTKGPELQARLLKHSQETGHWLEDWWDDGAYLGYRDSVSSRYIAVNRTRQLFCRSSSMYHTIVGSH